MPPQPAVYGDALREIEFLEADYVCVKGIDIGCNIFGQLQAVFALGAVPEKPHII